MVLASSDDYPDALVGTVLAAVKHAPVLFAHGAVLSATTTAEMRRVLPGGGTVYLLGGTRRCRPAFQRRSLLSVT